ncbi:MAG: TolC family protein, partial [Spirochaetales bacterium]|nr:TolC family protein [Spirochaetales bacterium]
MKKTIVIFILSILVVAGVAAYTVDELSSSMLAKNPDILKAREEVTKADLDVRDAKGGYSPTIDLTVTGSYIANPIDPIRIN